MEIGEKRNVVFSHSPPTMHFHPLGWAFVALTPGKFTHEKQANRPYGEGG